MVLCALPMALSSIIIKPGSTGISRKPAANAAFKFIDVSRTSTALGDQIKSQ
jgi:hypothetical protein